MRIAPRILMLGAVAVTLAPATPALAQDASAAPRGALQWTGCWDLQNVRTDDIVESAGSRQICVTPAGSALEVRTLVDGVEMRIDTLHVDGTPRAVEDAGCVGTESATVSADGNRLYTRSSLTCEGGSVREASGISALESPDVWIDIQVIRVEDARELIVRRFQFDEPAAQSAWTDAEAGDISLAARTARTAAADFLGIDDVVEASRSADYAAVEALLMETNSAFELDAGALLGLAEADVPGSIIDLMVALSFPDYFVVNEDPDAARGPGAYGYPVAFYGYWSPAFAPFGWGYGNYYPYYPCCGGGGGIGVRPPGGTRYGGRVVNGSGYARVAANPSAPSGGFGRFLSQGGRSVGSGRSGGGNGGNSGGAVSSGGATRGGSSSSGSSGTRTAKPRGH